MPGRRGLIRTSGRGSVDVRRLLTGGNDIDERERRSLQRFRACGEKRFLEECDRTIENELGWLAVVEESLFVDPDRVGTPTVWFRRHYVPFARGLSATGQLWRTPGRAARALGSRLQTLLVARERAWCWNSHRVCDASPAALTRMFSGVTRVGATLATEPCRRGGPLPGEEPSNTAARHPSMPSPIITRPITRSHRRRRDSMTARWSPGARRARSSGLPTRSRMSSTAAGDWTGNVLRVS